MVPRGHPSPTGLDLYWTACRRSRRVSETDLTAANDGRPTRPGINILLTNSTGDGRPIGRTRPSGGAEARKTAAVDRRGTGRAAPRVRSSSGDARTDVAASTNAASCVQLDAAVSQSLCCCCCCCCGRRAVITTDVADRIRSLLRFTRVVQFCQIG